MTGIDVGDDLIAVNDVRVPSFSALHGAPEEKRKLVLERKGSPVAVDARVSSFE